MQSCVKWPYKHPLLISVIFLVLDPSLSRRTHSHMPTDTGLRSGVCMRWQSALSVRSSAPTSLPDGHGVNTAPFAHTTLPTSFQPPPTPPATCNKVCNYKLSERCLVQKSSLALIWHDYSLGISGTYLSSRYMEKGNRGQNACSMKNNVIVATHDHSLQITDKYQMNGGMILNDMKYARCV